MNTNADQFQSIRRGNSSVVEFISAQLNDYGVYRCVVTAPVINKTTKFNNTTVTGECSDLVSNVMTV